MYSHYVEFRQYNVNSNSFALDKKLLLWFIIYYNGLYYWCIITIILLDMWSYLLAIYVRILQLKVNC